MKLPIIEETDYLVLGGNIRALQEAIRLSQEGRKVTIAVSDTFLGSDLCGTGRYEEKTEVEKLCKLPPSLVQKNGLLHPDRLKLFLEKMCIDRDIRLIYFVWKVEICEKKEWKLAKMVGKGGLFGILCREVRELAQREEDKSYRAFFWNDDFDCWSLFCAEREMRGRNIAENLYYCRDALLKKYVIERNKHPKWRLGRFAVRGYDDGTNNKHDTAARVEESMRREKEVQIQLGNELLQFEKYPVLEEPDKMVLEIKEYDLVVVGGGTAGVMAAIHGARGGLKTAIIEPNYELGGTGTVGGVTTYWFGRRFKDVAEIDEEVKKVSEVCGLNKKKGIWNEFEDFHAGIKSQVYLKKCLEAGVDISFGQIAFGVVKDDEKVVGVATAGEEGNVVYIGRIILDATGDGDVAVAAGADYETGNERDNSSFWSSLAQYPSAESYKNNFSCMMMAADPIDYTYFILNGRKMGEEMFDHGTYVSMRESRHIRGRGRISLKNLLTFEKYEDGLYTCFSNYDPKGKSMADIVYAGVLPPQQAIQIPLSALEPVDLCGNRIRGIYVLGKAISASHDIFPSIRMQPDLMHQGAVMGELSVAALKRRILPEDLPKKEIRDIIEKTTGDNLELPEWNILAERMVWEITPNTRINWVDVPFSYEEREQNPIITVMCADAQLVLPEIRKRLDQETDKELRSLLIECALWHGEDGWTEEFCEMLCKKLNSQITGLPERKDSVNCVQLLPDHGVMPEFVYQLNLLAWSQKQCILDPFCLVLEKLEKGNRDYLDIRKGCYHYVEAFAYVAERTGMKAFVPILERLLSFSEFKDILENRGERSPLTERIEILLLSLWRSMARLGEKKGYEGLIALLESRSASIACSACRELRCLTGAKYGLCPGKWMLEIDQNVRVNKVQRIKKKIW